MPVIDCVAKMLSMLLAGEVRVNQRDVTYRQVNYVFYLLS